MPVLRKEHVQEAAHRRRIPAEGNRLVRDRFPQQRQCAVDGNVHDLGDLNDFHVVVDCSEGIVIVGVENVFD